MNWDLMLNVVMSMVFFAPLLIALALFLFVGVLVLFEAAVVLAGKYGAPGPLAQPTAAAAELGPIALGLNAAVEGARADPHAPGRGRAAND